MKNKKAKPPHGKVITLNGINGIEEALSKELITARQNQADAEMRLELSGDIMRRVALALQQAPNFEKLQTLSRFIDKSIQLSGLTL